MTEATEYPDINQFVAEHGRLPQLGRDIEPWKFRGWLLYYVQLGDPAKVPEVAARWSYHLRTIEAGHLLDEPIPQITFAEYGGEQRNAGMSEINRWLDICFNDLGSISAFPALLDWLAWGLAVSREYPRLQEKTQEELYRKVNLEPVLAAPYDYLGAIYQDTRGNRRWNNTGYYVTPHNVVECMSRMLYFDEDGDYRLKTVCDPCVGSGRMLLHASNYSLRLVGQDIDPVCCTMCKINGAWFAPWLSFPLPAHIIESDVPAGIAKGNSLVVVSDPEPLPLPDILPDIIHPPPLPATEQPVYRLDDQQFRLF